MFALETKLEIGGDRELFERVSNSHRNPRTLMRQVGVLGMSSGLNRLTEVLKQDADSVRTGALSASLRVSDSGSGSENTIFDLGDDFVAVGSNLPYAAQVQFGGIIQPVPPTKALAIPLRKTLKLDRIGPRELDPGGDVLRFQPTSKRPNVIGVLIDDEGKLGKGSGPLYALALWVIQQPRPYLLWDEDDKRVIAEELYPQWLEL